MIYTEEEMPQRSEKWHEWREGRCMASEAPVIAGQPADYWKTKTWDDLRVQKAGLEGERTDYEKSIMQRGAEAESAILDMWSEYFSLTYRPVCMDAIADTIKYGASLDGYGLRDGEVPEWVEIKYGTQGTRSKIVKWAMSDQKQPPFHIFWQLVHQAIVVAGNHGTTKGYCYLVVGWHDGAIVTSYRKYEIHELLRAASALAKEWKRFLDGEAQHGGQRQLAAIQYKQADDALKAAKSEHEECKNLLLQFPDGKEDGISVTTSEKKGAIDWQAFAKALYEALLQEAPTLLSFDEHSEEYRKPTTKQRTIRRVK